MKTINCKARIKEKIAKGKKYYIVQLKKIGFIYSWKSLNVFIIENREFDIFDSTTISFYETKELATSKLKQNLDYIQKRYSLFCI